MLVVWVEWVEVLVVVGVDADVCDGFFGARLGFRFSRLFLYVPTRAAVFLFRTLMHSATAAPELSMTFSMD